MLTIATVPKPFKNPHINIIQRNAIQSWIRLSPRPQVILFGNDEGIGDVAKEFGILHIPEIQNEFGVPLLSSVFSVTKKMSENPYIAYINTDIVLMNDFIEAIKLIKFPKFLMAGRRWDVDIKEPIQFERTNWGKEIWQRVASEGKIHGPAGMDYFVFPRNLDLGLPNFVAGRPGYDSWMLYKARSIDIPVIDATRMVKIIHQKHGYSHRQGGEKDVLKKPEGKRNIELAGGFSQMLTLRDADWVLGPDGAKRPDFPERIFPLLSLFYPWRLLLALKRRIQQVF